MKELRVVCGVPGSGKSTYISDNLINEPNSVSISRDEIRFSLLDDKDDYFAKETEVFNTFIQKINEALADSEIGIVYADATHITNASRKKLLNRVKFTAPTTVVALNFITPLQICLERNLMREGRAIVPYNVIEKMYNDFRPVKWDDPLFDKVVDIKYDLSNIRHAL